MLDSRLDEIFLGFTNNNSKIDIVFTYVDPYDDKWKKKYQHYTNRRPNNYRFDFSKEQIEFSLSTIQRYCSWINHIYIVHDDQKFSLNFDSSFKNKITFIDHTKIIPYEYLPTFNSIIIECFLWKIPNLSKHFIYFNDDMFLGSNVSINDFFADHQIPIQFYQKFREYNHPWMRSIKNTNMLMQQYFPDYTNFISPSHAVYMIDKDLMEDCFTKFFKHFETMLIKDKTRTYNDYVHNLHFLYAMYAHHTGKAINKSPSFKAFYNIKEDHILQIQNLKNRKKFYCFHRAPRDDQQRSLYNRFRKAILSPFPWPP